MKNEHKTILVALLAITSIFFLVITSDYQKKAKTEPQTISKIEP